MKRLLLTLLFLPLSVMAQTIGLDTVSFHYPDKAYFNNANPGLYYRTASGIQVGAYHNTLDRTTFYAAKLWDIRYGFGLVAGLGTGYQKKYEQVDPEKGPNDCGDGTRPPCYANRGRSRGAISPILALTWASPPVFGVSARVTAMPGFFTGASSVAHLALEYAL